jgi:hypothetical protein
MASTRTSPTSIKHVAPMLLLGLLVLGLCAAQPSGDPAAALPFFVGEKLTYDVTVNTGGKIGTGTMWVEGPIDVRGTSTYRLRFDSKVKIAVFSGVSRSSSWFDPIKRVSLRYLKHERNPLSHDNESVEMYPEQKKWTGANGKGGASLGDMPLDELSFIYFIRTLPLTPGTTHRFDRHFDAARNPVVITVVRPEIIPTPLGELKTVLVEMRVRDPRHYKGDGLIRIHLTDDECRLPARIESTMPIVGKAVMTIRSENAAATCAKR